MTSDPLADRHILIVEDEFALANELANDLRRRGAAIVGPAGTNIAAELLLDEDRRIEGAVLDMNLRGEMAFALADRLARLDIPFVIASGYDASALPDRFRHVPHFDKPIDTQRLGDTLALMLVDGDGSTRTPSDNTDRLPVGADTDSKLRPAHPRGQAM